MVVTTGDTVAEPLSATDPMPLSMFANSAPAEVQLKIAEPPSVMVAAPEVKESMVGGLSTSTVTLSVRSP